MRKIFIACPYVKCFVGGAFSDFQLKEFLEELFCICQEYSDEVFMALKAEEYGLSPRENYKCSMDLEEICSSDVVIAIPDDSMGVAVELGWASAMGKRIISVMDKTKTYSPLIRNINTIVEGEPVWYEKDIMNTLSLIRESLKKYNQE